MTKKAKLLLLVTLGFAVFLFTTNPAELPSVTLILPFVLCFIIVFLALDIVFEHITKKHLAARTSLLLAGLVTLLAGLQSLGQLTLRDIVMFSLLFGIVFLYIRRKASAQ